MVEWFSPEQEDFVPAVMGIPGEFEHPAFEAAVRAIGQAAQRHGKLAATLASTPAWAGRFHAIGFRMFAYGLDVQLFQQALAAGIQSVRGLNRA